MSVGGATPNQGTVTFSDHGGTIGSATLADGVAEFTTSSQAAGTNTVTASYGGTDSHAYAHSKTASGTRSTASRNRGSCHDDHPDSTARTGDFRPAGHLDCQCQKSQPHR